MAAWREVGRNNLRVTLHRLREELKESANTKNRILLTDRDTARLDPMRLTTDVAEFRAALEDAAAATDLSSRAELLAEAVALYRGELMPGEFRDARGSEPSPEFGVGNPERAEPFRTEEDLALGLRMAAALARFWFVRGFISEGRERLTGVLAQRRLQQEKTSAETLTACAHVEMDSGLWAKALDGAGRLALTQGDFGAARSLYEQSLTIHEDRGDRPGALAALRCLGEVAQLEGDLARARSFFERSLELSRQWGDRQTMAESLHGLGVLAELEGDYSRAGSFFEQSVPIAREVGAAGWVAWGLHARGFAAWQQGDLAAGRALLAESLTIFGEMGHRYGQARSLERLAGDSPWRCARWSVLLGSTAPQPASVK